MRLHNKYHGRLCVQEIIEAETRIIKIIQAACFSRELKNLKNKNSTNKSKITALNPFIDENGLIRVGGRLKMSKLTFSQKQLSGFYSRVVIS